MEAVVTVWKIQNFTATQILCEIHFWFKEKCYFEFQQLRILMLFIFGQRTISKYVAENYYFYTLYVKATMRRVPWGSFLKRVYFTRSITQQQQWPQKTASFFACSSTSKLSRLGSGLPYFTIYKYYPGLSLVQTQTHTHIPIRRKKLLPQCILHTLW